MKWDYVTGMWSAEDSYLNPTNDVIPVRRNNLFADSPLTVLYDGDGNATDIVSSVSMTIPSGTLDLGGRLIDDNTLIRGVTSLKDSGESFLAVDSITGLTHTIPRTRINDDINSSFGVGRTVVQEADTFIWSSFGGTDTDTATISGTRKIVIEFVQVSTAYNTAQRIRGTQGKMHYRVIDKSTIDGIDTLVYTTEQGEPIDFSGAVAPNYQVEYITKNPNYLIKDHVLRVEFFSADGSDLTLKGQAFGTIPSTGDITNFVPFFETKFSNTKERIIHPNDEVVYITGDTDIECACEYAVEASLGNITITVDPDVVKRFVVFDGAESFGPLKTCTVEFLEPNTRTTPNDNIGAFTPTLVQAKSIDAGISGAKNLMSTGTTPKIYNDGTNWKVQLSSTLLDFTDVTARTGGFELRLLGGRYVLTVGDDTQLIDLGVSETLSVDTIGNSSNPIDSVTDLKLSQGQALLFDDKVVGNTATLQTKNDSYLFYWTGSQWRYIDVNYSKGSAV